MRAVGASVGPTVMFVTGNVFHCPIRPLVGTTLRWCMATARAARLVLDFVIDSVPS